MHTPCKTCKHNSIIKSEIRSFYSCNDENRKKMFKYDSFMYYHECDGYEVNEKCLSCKHYGKPYGNYCNSHMAEIDGKCVDYSESEEK